MTRRYTPFTQTAGMHIRFVEETRVADEPEFVDSMKDGVLLLTRFEPPKRAVRINISMDESLISAIDRAASAFGESRSHFLAEAAKLRLGNGDRLA